MNRTNLHVVFDRTELGVKIRNGWEFYPYEDIIEIRADVRYSEITIFNIKIPLCIDVPLKIFAENLPLIFFKYKRSGIINLAYISSYLNEDRKLRINLKDGTFHYVSRYLKDVFYDKIQNLSRISLPCDTCKFCTKKESCADIAPFVRHNPITNS
jgi:DNA-binding LytR/AlgR family response regulator